MLLDCLLHVAEHLEHRDCLALEVCCKDFQRVLGPSIFHEWKSVEIKTARGYRLEYPNGCCTFDSALYQSTELFSTAPKQYQVLAIGDYENGERWLTRFYTVDIKPFAIIGLLWRDQFWCFLCYRTPAWWTPLAPGPPMLAPLPKSVSLNSLPMELTAEPCYGKAVDLDASLDPKLADYVCSRLFINAE